MKKIIGFVTVCYAFVLSATHVLAQGVKDTTALVDVANKAGLEGKADLGTVVGGVVAGALSLLGIIFLVLMVYAGLLWMTAKGKDEQIEKARNIIIGAIIGLFITVSAYAITVFVTANFSK